MRDQAGPAGDSPAAVPGACLGRPPNGGRLDRTVCYCMGVSESTIVAAVRDGMTTLDAVREATGACTGAHCAELNPTGRCCSGEVLRIIARETGKRHSSSCCSGNGAPTTA